MTATAAYLRQAPHRSPVQGTRPTSWKRFARHYLLMIVAMYAGMLVLDPVYTVVATRAGYPDPWTDLPVVSTLVMTVNMTSPMVLLMLRHGKGSRAILEMAASMVAPTLTAAGLHALGALGADQVMSLAHLAMFPAMLLVMLRRYREYAAPPCPSTHTKSRMNPRDTTLPTTRLVDTGTRFSSTVRPAGARGGPAGCGRRAGSDCWVR